MSIKETTEHEVAKEPNSDIQETIDHQRTGFQTNPAWHNNAAVPPQNEVSLLDVALIIIKHKKALFSTIAAILILGTVLIATTSKKYRYSVVIESGTYSLPDEKGSLGDRKPIEPIGNTQSKIETSFIPKVLMEHTTNNTNAPSSPIFNIRVPAGANIIEISADAGNSPQIEENTKKLLGEIATQVIQDHQKKSADVLEQLRQNIEALEMNVKSLKTNLIEQTKNRETLQGKADNLATQKGLVEKQISRLTTEINALQNTKKEYIQDPSKPKDALAILLINTEINQNGLRRDELENQAFVILPNEETALRKTIETKNAQIDLKKSELEQAQRILKRYRSDNTENADKLAFTNIDRNIYPTKISVEPYRSNMPNGISNNIALAATVILALFFGVLSTFISEFISKLKSRRPVEDL